MLWTQFHTKDDKHRKIIERQNEGENDTGERGLIMGSTSQFGRKQTKEVKKSPGKSEEKGGFRS